ncbi:MAG: hypothetical protein R2789_11615 [Microthrixaceae bacterium]
MVRTTVVADFEAFFSRPVAPTRRIAVGELRFPRAATGRDESARVAAASMLLGGVVASFAPGLDEDDTSELHRLIDNVDSDWRVPQPRLRHRLQKDRVGLKRSINRLVELQPQTQGSAVSLRVQVDRTNGTATQHCLAAVYCAMALDEHLRSRVFRAPARPRMGRDPGEDLLAVLRVASASGDWLGGGNSAGWGRGANGSAVPMSVSADPINWALELLGLGGEPEAEGPRVHKRMVQRAFRPRCVTRTPTMEHPSTGRPNASRSSTPRGGSCWAEAQVVRGARAWHAEAMARRRPKDPAALLLWPGAGTGADHPRWWRSARESPRCRCSGSTSPTGEGRRAPDRAPS